MAELFKEDGYEIVDFTEFSDVYVVNTCTVTNMSDRKSRQILRRAKDINPNSILCVVGCYVQVNKDELSKLDYIDILLGTNDRKDIVKYVNNFNKKNINIVSDIMKKQEYTEWGGIAYTSHQRAEIKIQDGCDRFCTYCIIPYARGPVRSRDIKEIVRETKNLVNNGIKEVVLTGIHISSYGKDLKSGDTLIDVLKEVNKIDGLERIRLGSLEPLIITEAFIREILKLKKVCNHFHLSLQSGCDETLKRMNRRYTSEEYKDIVKLIRKFIPEVAITTDVIVGFPGETDEEFNTTYEFLKEINFSKLHVFKYSPRKGTKAASLPNQIDGTTKSKRSDILIKLSNNSEEEFAKKYIGKEIDVLFENNEEGHTTNYIKVIDVNNIQVSGKIKKVIPYEYKNGALMIRG